jgi:hypothetical protein
VQKPHVRLGIRQANFGVHHLRGDVIDVEGHSSYSIATGRIVTGWEKWHRD